ncbi:methyl-accepting chemotaxis protein [Nitrosomonas supralitoralis]|uniref:Methyl-accepting chemotaxis protein n=1 Tax=Nitrosomonas supralitoralis TaxID=2116706 RepID=A0A2P7NT46_9PROT|nr:methyl-accepting chemotaxis protein [Nitrosomonas supralitoralis]PSJ16609.1 methyl-accepting chemotaxis protein [Nitrosomonas supralitoralis]
MENNFSKLELTTSLVAIGKKLPVISLPAKKNIPKNSSLLNDSWMLGGIVMFCTVLLLITMIISVQKARNNALKPELVSQLQMQHLRLSKAAQQIIIGKISAFTQLQDSQDQLKQYITLLSEGGMYRDKIIPAVDEALSQSFNTYLKNWQIEEKNIHLILSRQDSLTRLIGSTQAIHIAHSQLTRRIEELIVRMAQIGNLSHEIRTVEVIRMHARNVARNVKMLLPIELPLAEITAQLVQDHEHISAITHALSQGDNGLGAASSRDEMIQDLLSHVYALVRKFDDHLDVIQQEISIAVTVQSAIDEIVSKGDVMLNSSRELGNEIQAQTMHSISWLNKLTIMLGVCLLLALIFFIRSVRQNVRYQDFVSRNEVIKTQKAIVTLLDDMKRIADGDLTVRTDITDRTTGAIADAINCTIEELHTLVEQVNQASVLVVKASNQAQQVSSGLLTAAQQQTAKIEQTTIAVLGMTESISEISDMATESARVAKQSLATAEKGTSAVRESIAGMNEIRTYIQDTSKRIKRLGESSQEIGEIVALITDITDQTNVLALNAALQATAAGEAGHGFTVIAQEVQRLAERSAEASKQIGELIVTIQGDTQDAITAMERSTLGVAKGAKRSDAAGRALEEIEQVSKQLAHLVSNIFDVTNTQTRAAHKVVANMEEILHITRQNTQGTLKTTGSIKQISGFASELKASVSNFKV